MKSIAIIKEEFEKLNIEKISSAIALYESDNRAGVIKLIKIYENKLRKYEEQVLKLAKMKQYEEEMYKKGKRLIAGIDEVGRGPLAGPVVTASVILPEDFNILGIDDSKKLSEKKRDEFYEKILANAIEVSISMEDNNTIDKINILEATKKSMLDTIYNFENIPDFLIIDAVKLNIDIPYLSMPKADEKSVSVASASIVAKVTRDRLMEKMHKIYPQYSFDKNKGYGSQEHIEALKKYGACEIHRKSFIKNLI